MSDSESQPKPVTQAPVAPKPKAALPMWKTMLAAGVAACTAECVTLPLDTIKVRLQLFPGKYNGFMDCGKNILRTEGLGAFWQGLQAGLLRQVVFGTLRIGMFDYGMQSLVKKKGEENIGFFDRVGLGIMTGAFAMCVANPTDVVKVRFQAEIKADTGGPPRYNNAFHAFKVIFAEEGLTGFYQSLAPNVMRNSVINAVELASYSQVKYEFSKGMFKWFDEGIPLHLWASSCAGILAVCVGSPFDVIKSRVMDGRPMPDGTKQPYPSLMNCVSSTYAENGVKSFYKGFIANCQRMVSWNICMFVLREQILDYMKSRSH